MFIIFTIIFLAFSLLLFMPIKINIVYRKKEHIDFKIVISFLGIIIFSRNFSPFLKRKNGIYKHINSLSLFRVSKVLKLIFRSISIKSIKLNFNVHNDNNSAITGILAGCYWSIIGIILSFLSHKLDLSNTDIAVKITPVFSKDDDFPKTFFNSIFYIRVGNIIIISIIVLFFIVYNKLWFPKIKRGGIFGKSSNRRVN